MCCRLATDVFFVNNITIKRLDHFAWIFREGVDWPWDNRIAFSVNCEKPHDAVMCNTGTGFVVLSLHSLLIICCDQSDI